MNVLINMAVLGKLRRSEWRWWASGVYGICIYSEGHTREFSKDSSQSLSSLLIFALAQN